MDWLDATDLLANLTVSKSAEFVEENSRTQAGEPTLSQIMSAKKQCQVSLSMQIDTLRVDFYLLKDNVHKE